MNKTIEKRVTLFKDGDVDFPFKGDASFHAPGEDGSWGQTIYIQLFPCYSHNKDLVIKTVKEVESKFEIGFKPNYFLLPFDTKEQTNGWADPNRLWNGKKNKEANEFRPQICLAGKRIPPMPSMTRYLVAHEYGHCVDYWLNYCLGYKEDEPTQFDKDYAKMREIKLNTEYGGRKWHKNIGEIIANDFRIAVCNIEPEFWPHEVKHPLESKNVLNFWREMKEKYATK